MEKKKISPLYKAIKALVRFFYPPAEIIGKEKLPDEPVIVVGNHAQMNGPIVSELYWPGEHYTWCSGEMMELKEVPDYAFRDFWSRKPRWIRWFYRLLSYIIAPFSVCIFRNANTIPVYHDARIMTTFRRTVEKLSSGASVVIFPEHDAPYDHIICDFQDKFVDVARIYYKKTGRELCFVPIYIAPALKKTYIGASVRYDASAAPAEERKRICGHLMGEISSIARALPEHRVVPYNNVAKKYYPMNTKVE